MTSVDLVSSRATNPFGASPRPQRSLGLRADTDFPALLHDGVIATHCRAVELSSTGIVLERRRSGRITDTHGAVRLELYVPGIPRPVRALARPVRWMGTRQALKLLTLSDVDRLLLAEHVDARLRSSKTH